MYFSSRYGKYECVLYIVDKSIDILDFEFCISTTTYYVTVVNQTVVLYSRLYVLFTISYFCELAKLGYLALSIPEFCVLTSPGHFFPSPSSKYPRNKINFHYCTPLPLPYMALLRYFSLLPAALGVNLPFFPQIHLASMLVACIAPLPPIGNLFKPRLFFLPSLSALSLLCTLSHLTLT